MIPINSNKGFFNDFYLKTYLYILHYEQLIRLAKQSCKFYVHSDQMLDNVAFWGIFATLKKFCHGISVTACNNFFKKI